MDGARGEIWAYTDRLAYTAGDTVQLFISSTTKRVSIQIGRDGADYRTVYGAENVDTRWQETPADCSVTGCGWQPEHEFVIAQEWPSGAYRIRLQAENLAGEIIESWHLFIVCPQTMGQVRGRLLQIAATSTWTAYNTWGGSNHYQGITGPSHNEYATTLSLQRPFGRGFVTLPDDAPRVPLEFTPGIAATPRYPHMEWAFAHGYSKKYASAGWASYDRHFFQWAERAGYRIDLASQHELHYRPELLNDYDCVAFVGHDEYWSAQMRDAIDDYVDGGGKVARFAGNFMWQIRLQDEGRRQVCYKYRARAEDPVYGTTDQRYATTSWEAAEVNRPGAASFGLNASRGLYAGWGGCAPRGNRGFPIYRPEHWAFAGTGLYYGDILGDESHIFGYEVDGLDYVIRNGLPEATGKEGAPEGVQILGLGLSSTVEGSAEVPGADQFLADEDGRFIAETLYDSRDDQALDKVKRGSGMIVHFHKGQGEVFHAGSCEWVAGLLRNDPQVHRVSCNVLNRYLGNR